MLVGLIAGLLAFGFAKVFGEPQVDRAIAFEGSMAHLHGEAEEPELVSREVQASFGLLTGVVVYSVSLGGIFALVFAYSLGRIGKVGPRGLAALLALAAFVVVFVVPGLTYPPNPPAVGNPDTLGQRTQLFFLMILISVAAAVIAFNTARKAITRFGLWNGAIAGVALYLLIVALAGYLFPVIDEVPDDFSAVLLWKFRTAALGIQLVLWTSLGLIFGSVAERALQSAGKAASA
jgi:hypothetical protein